MAACREASPSSALSPRRAATSPNRVTQNTKRFTRCFWALDKSLAYARHYPAINWTSSYSEYLGDLSAWYTENVGEDFIACRTQISKILQEESQLMEIVKLIGADVLPDDQKLVIETARVIRTGFLQQNAYHQDDTFVPMEKQLKMMRVILHLHKAAQALIATMVPLSQITALGLFDKVSRIKYDVPNDRLEMLDAYMDDIDEALASIKR